MLNRPSGVFMYRAGPPPGTSAATRPRSCCKRRRIGWRSRYWVFRPVVPIGIASIRRRTNPCSMQKSIMSSISSSFTPRIATILIFIGVKPASFAAASPARILSRTSRPQIAATRSARRESRLTLTRRTPAAFNGAASACNRVALVLKDRSSMPGIAASRAARSGKSRRTSGSPPVRRTRFSPRGAIMDIRRSISSNRNQEAGS